MHSLTILVVDDDPVTRNLLQKRLVKENYEIDLAENGVAAVRQLQKKRYDIVLTDLKMPGGVDGIGVLETAKEADIKTEVILITAHASVGNAIEAMKKGASDYLEKPINFDELLMRLQKVRNTKALIKNASDLREAMNVTEQTSAETIQHLELLCADFQARLERIQSILNDTALAPLERVTRALEI
ncbi:MAG: response regulator [Desulfosarcinaceae bacterium]|nr:response regulator [Desulfosarcinaceae bacterium]